MSNVSDFLKKKAKSPEAKAKKDQIPILELPQSEGTKKALKTLIEEKQKEKTAEGLRKQAEDILRPICAEIREKHCMEEHKFLSSVKVKVDDVGPVTFTNQCKYSEIPADKEEELKKEVGADYDKYFRLQTEIALTEKGMKLIESIVPLLQAAADKVCGKEEAFDEIFQVKQCIKPTEQFHQERTLDAKIAGTAKKLIEEGLVKPQNSSFTV